MIIVEKNPKILLNQFQNYEILNNLEIFHRKQEFSKWIKNANDLYNEISKRGIIFFDNNCSGEHLPFWNRVVNRLNKQENN